MTVNLTVAAPEQPGEYVLELDVVEEGRDLVRRTGVGGAGLPSTCRGRPARRACVTGCRGSRKASGAAETSDGDGIDPEPFSMTAVPRAEVEALVTAAGGIVVHVEPSGSSGPSGRHTAMSSRATEDAAGTGRA